MGYGWEMKSKGEIMGRNVLRHGCLEAPPARIRQETLQKSKYYVVPVEPDGIELQQNDSASMKDQ